MCDQKNEDSKVFERPPPCFWTQDRTKHPTKSTSPRVLLLAFRHAARSLMRVWCLVCGEVVVVVVVRWWWWFGRVAYMTCLSMPHSCMQLIRVAGHLGVRLPATPPPLPALMAGVKPWPCACAQGPGTAQRDVDHLTNELQLGNHMVCKGGWWWWWWFGRGAYDMCFSV